MNNTVLITGVSSGIGKAAAKIFHENKWDVIGVDISGSSNKYCKYFINADISDPDEITNIFNNLPPKTRKLDAVVNNAAVQICKQIIDTTLQDWNDTINTNLRAVFIITKLAIPYLKKARGTIVNVSSVHAVATSDAMSSYAASKGGITAFTRSSAIELGKHNIRVNAILPGAVNTKMLKDGLERGHLTSTSSQELLAELAAKHPLGKIGKPKEIADLIYFLTDNKRSSFITGQCFVVDGGATARLSTE